MGSKESNKLDEAIQRALRELGESLETNDSVERLRQRVNEKYENGPVLSDLRINNLNTHIVKRPTVPNKATIGSFSTRYECFKKLIEKVNYGIGNSSSYVEGHAEALKKYFAQAQSTPNDLGVVEGRVNDEIAKYNNIDKGNVYIKGYYDGLLYVYRSLRKSKDLIVAMMNEVLVQGLGETHE